MARDDVGPLSSNFDTLFGRWRSAFSSRLHARVLRGLTSIGLVVLIVLIAAGLGYF